MCSRAVSRTSQDSIWLYDGFTASYSYCIYKLFTPVYVYMSQVPIGSNTIHEVKEEWQNACTGNESITLSRPMDGSQVLQCDATE